MEWRVTWYTTALMWRHRNGTYFISNTYRSHAISFTHNTAHPISSLITRQIICGISIALILLLFFFTGALGKVSSYKWYHMMTLSNGNIFRVTGPSRSPVNSPHKGQWRGALMLALKCARTNGRVNNRDAANLRHHCAHYNVTVMN